MPDIPCTASTRSSSSPESPQSGTKTTLRQWLAVTAVTIGSFAFVTAEYLPVGLLPGIAHDLHVSSGIAGLMVTTPAAMALVFASLLVIVAGRVNRRSVFLLLTAMLLASCIASAISTDFASMLAGRAVLGASLGGFWTLATAAAGRLVRPKDSAKAVAAVFAGVTLATVLGVPLSTFIAGLSSWRVSFGATGALAALALLLQFIFVPSLPPASTRHLSGFADLLRRRSIRLIALIVTLITAAHFATYTYVTPWLQQTFAPHAITVLLFGFGIAGFASNALSSLWAPGRLPVSIAIMTSLMLCVIVLMALPEHSAVAQTAAVLSWGVAFGSLPLCLNLFMLRESADLPDAGAAIFVSVSQLAIAIGSSAGGRVVDMAGARADFMFGAALGVCGLIFLFRLSR